MPLRQLQQLFDHFTHEPVNLEMVNLQKRRAWKQRAIMILILSVILVLIGVWMKLHYQSYADLFLVIGLFGDALGVILLIVNFNTSAKGE